MQIEQARVLRDALSAAITEAEQSGAAEVNVTGALDAELTTAIGELQAAIDAGGATHSAAG